MFVFYFVDYLNKWLSVYGYFLVVRKYCDLSVILILKIYKIEILKCVWF